MNKNFILFFLLLTLGAIEVSGIAAQDMAPPGSYGDVNWGSPDLAAPSSSGSWELRNSVSSWGKKDLSPVGSGNSDSWGKRDLQAPGSRDTSKGFSS